MVMPPKDDDDPKSTKEVVSKKHKQMLNREELDLSLVAEAFGGIIVEADVVQPSLPGTGRRSIKKQEVPSSEDPREKLKRLLKTSRRDKYQTNEPVSGKQVQQFDIDISGKAAEEKSGAGGKPGAGQTKSLRGQTLTGGKFKGATPIGKREASILRKYAQASGGVGQNPLRSEPGSGAELTAGRKRSLKASARRAVEKKEQIARSARGKEIRKAGSELLSQMQKQAKGRKALEKRMGKAVGKWAQQEGPKVLKQVQGEAPPKTPKGQLSFPGMGKSFGRGAERRASAAQDAAIDIAKQQKINKGFSDLIKAVKGTRPVSGAARDPWKQFPKKPQKQYGLPKPEQPSTPSTKALPPAKEVKVGMNVPSQPPKPSQTLNVLKRVRPGSPLTIAANLVVGSAIDYAAKKYVIDPLGKALGKKLVKSLIKPSKGRNLFPSYYSSPQGKEYQGPDLEPDIASRLRNQNTGRTGIGTRQGAAPRLQRQPQPAPTFVLPKTGTGVKPPDQEPKGRKRGGFNFAPPGGLNLYLGRRQNPQ